MAAISIPEVIVPGSLYAPDDTAFSIASSAMPNTDDLLELDDSATWRAYQAATAGVHYPSDPADPFTVCFWITMVNASIAGSANSLDNSEIVMGVWGASADSAFNTNAESTSEFRWAVGLVEPESNRLVYHRAKGATSRAYARFRAVTSTDPTLVVIRDPGTSAPNVRINGLNTPSSDAYSGGSNGTPGSITSPFFSLGPYPSTAGWDSPTGTIQLGKVALFNRLLSDAEINSLWLSATLGPPSP